MPEIITSEMLTRPRPRMRWWDDPYGVLLRTALIVGWLPGFSLGLVLMLELAILQRIGMGWWPHAQTHAHAQIYGFVGLFFFGVATQILPRFLGAPLQRRGWISIGGVLLGLSLIGRLSVQPFGASELRNALLLLSAILGLAGALLIVAAYASVALRSDRPRERWQLFLAVGMASWVLGSGAVCWATVGLAQGQLLVPQPINELALLFGFWGFALPVTLAVGTRVFPNFLLLQDIRPRMLTAGVAGYAVGLALAATSWILQSQNSELIPHGQGLRALGWLLLGAGGGAIVWSLRIFERPARASVSPHITHPTRRWFRLAFGYLFLSLGMGVWLTAREWLQGAPPGATELSAQRHALAMGYLMPIIVGMAGRILPEFSGDMTRRPRVLAALVWLWLVGAGLRVGGELWGGYSGPGTPIMVLGATLGFISFAWFSVLLWKSISRRKPETYAV